MTSVLDREVTGAPIGPTGRSLWHTARAPIIVAAVIFVVAVIVVIANGRGVTAPLDPKGTDPEGGHALATLLRDHGVVVDRTTDVGTAARAGRYTTILVVDPAALGPAARTALSTSAARLVLVAPSSALLDAVGVNDISTYSISNVRDRAPQCALPAAVLAGSAETGGLAYIADGSGAVSTCYPAAGGATVVVDRGTRDVTVLGSATILVNHRLAHSGNAALALNLLGTTPRVLWVVPGAQVAATTGGQQSLLDLLPHPLVLAAVQLLLAVAIVGIWRGRRLGRLVPEPLPVVVRAAEAVEGRARLYEAAHARARAATALRTATITRLLPALGLPRDSEADAVVAAVAGRVGTGPAVHDLLYGAAPADDPALVRLADSLDRLEAEVRRG